jgi:hypothetical protein
MGGMLLCGERCGTPVLVLSCLDDGRLKKERAMANSPSTNMALAPRRVVAFEVSDVGSRGSGAGAL